MPLWRALHTRKANMTRGLKGLVELLSLYFRGFIPVEFVRGDDRITQHASGWRVNGSGHLERAKDAVAYLEQAPAEEWRQVYCGINLFLVSDRGNVKKHDGTPAETFILNGRCQIKYQIVKFGRLRNREIYRSHLVAMAFLNYQRGDEREIHHINGYRMDDSVANLVVLSREDHAKVHGYGATAPTGPVEKDMPLPKQRTRKGAKPARGKHAGAPAGLSYALETVPEVPLVGVPSVEEEGEPQTVETTARECAPKRRRRKSSAKRHAERRGTEAQQMKRRLSPRKHRRCRMRSGRTGMLPRSLKAWWSRRSFRKARAARPSFRNPSKTLRCRRRPWSARLVKLPSLKRLPLRAKRTKRAESRMVPPRRRETAKQRRPLVLPERKARRNRAHRAVAVVAAGVIAVRKVRQKALLKAVSVKRFRKRHRRNRRRRLLSFRRANTSARLRKHSKRLRLLSWRRTKHAWRKALSMLRAFPSRRLFRISRRRRTTKGRARSRTFAPNARSAQKKTQKSGTLVALRSTLRSGGFFPVSMRLNGQKALAAKIAVRA